MVPAATCQDKSRVKRVPVGLTRFALVDAEDFERVSAVRWYAAPDGRIGQCYARTKCSKTGRYTSMHRLIVGPTMFPEIDHKDGNGLNNCKDNLRPCTCGQNQANRTITWGQSRFRGVSFHKPYGKWRARILGNSCRRFLGYFDTEEEAAMAYDRAATALWGEFYRPNIPPPRSDDSPAEARRQAS